MLHPVMTTQPFLQDEGVTLLNDNDDSTQITVTDLPLEGKENLTELLDVSLDSLEHFVEDLLPDIQQTQDETSEPVDYTGESL